MAATGASTIHAVTPMIFSGYNPVNSSPNEATALLTVTCTLGIPYNIGFNKGEGVGATESERSMTEISADETGLLRYDLFQNSNCTKNWGDIIGKDCMNMIGNNLPQQLVIYGKIMADSIVKPGVYMDKITVNVTF